MLFAINTEKNGVVYAETINAAAALIRKEYPGDINVDIRRHYLACLFGNPKLFLVDAAAD